MKDVNLKEINKYLENAEERIESAEVLKDTNHYNDAISRVYYAFFDAATAALLSKNLTAKTHHKVVQIIMPKNIKRKIKTFSRKTAFSLLAFLMVFQTAAGVFLPVEISLELPYVN